MAPGSLLTAGVSLLAKSVSVLSISGCLSRYRKVLPATCFSPIKYLTTGVSGPPKKPLNGFLRYSLQQRPLISQQNQDMKTKDVTRKIAEQWQMLSQEQKQVYKEACVQDWEQYKVDWQRYHAQLSPVQLLQRSEEKRKRSAKRKAIIKKRELGRMGKPKRFRSAINIFISEHYQEAKGVTNLEKMRNLTADWKKLLDDQKKVYMQLAEDDKIRYLNEMRSWEDHMIEIGRQDLIRGQSLSALKKSSIEVPKKVQTSKVVKGAGVRKATATKGKKTIKSDSTKTPSKKT